MNKKRWTVIFSLFLLALTLAGGVIHFVIIKMRQQSFPELTAGTEAVLTTKVKIINGMGGTDDFASELYQPQGIALAKGAIIVCDTMNDRVQIIGEENIWRVGKSGTGAVSYASAGGLVDGYLSNAEFKKPSDIAIAENGDLIVCDAGNHVIRKITNELVVTIAGNGNKGYQEGKEGEASFYSPQSIAIAEDGTIYVADTMNHCIRTIDAAGNVALFAGVPETAGYQDGGLSEAMFYEPCGLAFGADGALYIADSANQCIRKITGQTVSTVAGAPGAISSETSYPTGGYVDGAQSQFSFPKDLVVMEDGTIYVADTLNHAIRQIKDGETKTVLGNGTAGKYHVNAENMTLSRPSGITSEGINLYITDSVNNSVLVVPITQRLEAGRTTRAQMLAETGITIDEKYPYHGEVRLFVNGERVQQESVKAWNTSDKIYIPIKPVFEAIGATIHLDNQTKDYTITKDGVDTVLVVNESYFLLQGVAVTTSEEIMRLFPYTLEWYPEFSVIAIETEGR